MEGLTVQAIITNGFQRGIKNIVPILVNTILWILTIWIPYLNVGTSIGMLAGVVAKMSRGETISMTEIFNPAYRKRMGEFFIVFGLMFMGIGAGFLFFIIPGYVIAIAWCLAPLFVVDREMNPLEAIHKSNTATYGKKWIIFGALLVIGIIGMVALGIVFGILGYIFAKVGAQAAILGKIVALIMALLYIAGYAAFISIQMAAFSYIYGELSR